MRALKHCGTVLALLVAGTVSFSAAWAGELLVMPYSCKVVGGRPLLAPSEDQGHQVFGRREQQEFRACSPADPRLCRRWNVHRFDLDCGGVRVPWVEVAAAAGAGREGRAFVDNGRFELEMPAQWGLAPDEPCARGGDIESAGLRRFCAERLAGMARVTVAMPKGFAPMLGIDGIFVKDTAPHGAVAEAVPAQRETVPAPTANPRRSVPSAQSGAEAVKTAPPKEPAPAQAQPQAIEALTPKAAPPPQAAPTELSAAGQATAGAAPVIPQIINGANGSVPPHGGGGIAETGALPDHPSPPRAGDTAAAASEVAGHTASMPDRVALAERDGASSLLPAVLAGGPLAEHAAVITAGTLALLTLLTLAVVFRRGRASAVPVLSRDIASISLGRDGAGDVRPGAAGALAVVPEPLTGREVVAQPRVPPGSPAPAGEVLPRTRQEALEVLGMGIGPDVNEAAIKKIIDGLRLSWHPDHARDAEDRVLRERRLKQINAAWDIIADKRAAAQKPSG